MNGMAKNFLLTDKNKKSHYQLTIEDAACGYRNQRSNVTCTHYPQLDGQTALIEIFQNL